MKAATALGAAAVLVVAAMSIAFFQASDPASLLAEGRLSTARTFPPALVHEGTGASVELHLGRSLSGLDPDRDALLVIGPAVAHTPDDVKRIRSFVEAGGVVLIAGRGGGAAQLATDLQLGVGIGEGLVYTPLFESSAERVVVLSTGVVLGLPSESVLVRPAPTSGGRPFWVTPELAWADIDADHAPDVGERLGALPVGAVASAGRGALYVVGSPSIFYDDSAASRALLSEVGKGDRRFVVDEGHRLRTDPFRLGPFLAGDLGGATTAVILMVLSGLVGSVVLRPRLRPSATGAGRAGPTVPASTIADLLSELDE